MTKKNLLLVALAAVAFAACSDDFADAPPVVTPDPEAREIPIMFSSSSNGLTRAEYTGAVAADMLGGHFVVSGYKGSQSTWDGDDNSIVFDNFLVEWQDNTANTTESNTNNWEYVGVGPIDHATAHGITRQTIKYWDYSQAQYDFIAWSTGTKRAIYSGTPSTGQVLVSAIEAANAKTAAYTFTGTADDLSQCYIADMVTVKKTDGNGTDEYNVYGKPVKLTFRSLGSKVRIAIYETIPGYSVRDVQFYTAAATADVQDDALLFTTKENNIYTHGTYTVSYPTLDAPNNDDNNQAHITFSGEDTGHSTTIEDWGGLNYTIAEDAEKTKGAVFLGRSSNTASFAGNAANNYYVYYLPNEEGTNLNLRVNFTLESIDGTGEVINVKGATAQVPSIYAAWKPGFAYTYIFKISDKTNGHTGPYNPENPDDLTLNSDPAGLYPITFDAVVVNSEDNGNTQETITTVSAPSITTYQKGSNVVNNDEYTPGNNIFVTVNDGEKDETPDLANGKVQTLTTTNAALYTIPEGKTEADVVAAMQMQDKDDAAEHTIKGRSGLVLTEAESELTTTIEYGVDGNAINLTVGKALSFSPATGTYAFVYTKTASTTETEKYQAVAFDDTNVATKWRYKYIAAPEGDVQAGVLYFESETSGKKTVFLGQNVSNLMLRTGDGDTTPYSYTKASGYAKTGDVYCYGIDNKVAHNVAFGTTIKNVLYEADEEHVGEFKLTQDTTPEDGKAYYYKDGSNYIYCVFLPEQANGLLVLDTNTFVEADEDTAVDGMTYFDKYVVNNGVYYAKVIKVQ